MAAFQRPLNTARSRDNFGNREVGLTHPDLPSFIRLTDSGTIEIIAGDNFGVVLDPKNRSINFFGDSIKFFTKEIDGIRWNKLSFNHRATKYTEPAFVEQDADTSHLLFNDVDNILDGS